MGIFSNLTARFSRLRHDSSRLRDDGVLDQCTYAITRPGSLHVIEMILIWPTRFSWLILIGRVKPLVAVLENVYGLLDVWNQASYIKCFKTKICNDDGSWWFFFWFAEVIYVAIFHTSPYPITQVQDKMRSSGVADIYFLGYVKLCPSRCGEPVTRRRIYILLLRKSLSCMVMDQCQVDWQVLVSLNPPKTMPFPIKARVIRVPGVNN